MKWSNVYRIRMMLVIFAAAIMLGGLAQAATITVGSGAGYDYDSIQAGIDAAVDGDKVLVAPGEYVITESITFRGKAIMVISEEGPDETTIRMGTPADANNDGVVLFENNETAASILEGFTIIGGRGSSSGPPYNSNEGGGIMFNAASGTIRNCAIVQNTGTWGGGICGFNPCSPALIDCTIAENSCVEDGGGVWVFDGCSMTLTNCIVRGNSNTGVENGGGGVSCLMNSSITMTDCIVSGNSSKYVGGGVHAWEGSLNLTRCTIVSNTAESGTGGGVFTANSSTTLTNCVIARNTAQMGGGGVLSLFADDFITISNCTIWGNSAGATYGGGGICCYDQASASVTNSIFWENTAPTGREISLVNGAEFDISYSDVAGGQTGISVVFGGGTINWGEGNIDADPLLADPTNDDYHLKSQAGRWYPNSQVWLQDDATSPCIDAGDPMSPIGWEPFPNGGFVNMGAYGGTPEASKSYFGEPICGTIIAGDINGDCQVNQADLEIMALHWTGDEPLLP